MTATPRYDTNALVLGGGGSTGQAWEIGLLLGLQDAGVDLRDADLVVGTSAGAIVGAQLTSGLPLEQCYQLQSTTVAFRRQLARIARTGRPGFRAG